MRPKIVGNTRVEREIGISPDQLDRNIKRLHLGKALGVSSDLLEDLRGQAMR